MTLDDEALSRAVIALARHKNGTIKDWYKHTPEAEVVVTTYLSALEAKGMVIVPSSKQLEFARTREGAILVGYNPRSEEGGWVCVGNVTTAVTKIEAERDEALDSLAKAKQRIAAVRIATGDLSATDGEAGGG